MATATYIWTNQNGKKTPLALMDDDHLKNIYRRCVEVAYMHQSVALQEDVCDGYHSYWHTPLTLEEGDKMDTAFRG